MTATKSATLLIFWLNGMAGPVRAFQSGVINDYVTWIVVGVAGVGGILALTLR